MLVDRGQLHGEGRTAPRTRVDDGGRYVTTPETKASHRLHRRSTTSRTARPSGVPFLTTENTGARAPGVATRARRPTAGDDRFRAVVGSHARDGPGHSGPASRHEHLGPGPCRQATHGRAVAPHHPLEAQCGGVLSGLAVSPGLLRLAALAHARFTTSPVQRHPSLR